MSEYKTTAGGKFKRTEQITYLGSARKALKMAFKGPFDYELYNDDSVVDDASGDESGRQKRNVSVNRPPPAVTFA